MGFCTAIPDGFAKMRAATLLGDIFHLHQCTKNPLNYVHKKSKYGNIFAIPASDTREYFSKSSINKGWFEKIFSICQVERRKIRVPWHNICQSICLRYMNMKQCLPIINMGFLSVLPRIQNQLLKWLMMPI